MIKALRDKRYKFIQVSVRFRWVDYERIRACFPAQRNETAVSYFYRLALWLKKLK